MFASQQSSSIGRAALLAVLFVVAAAPSAFAQKWSKQSISALGIELRCPDTLEVSPLDASPAPQQKMHLKHEYSSVGFQAWEGSNFPKDGKARILVFPGKLTDEQKKGGGYSRNFEDFVRNNQVYKGERTIHTPGKRSKGKGKVPEHRLWEYSESVELIEGKGKITHYHVGAVYDLGENELAFVFDFWAFDNKPSKKLIKNGKKMVQSVVPTSVVDASSSFGKDARAKFADTPAKVAALETAVARVQDLEGWDFTTTERFIVLYSHDGGSKQKKAAKIATGLANSLSMMRAKFEEDWPPTQEQELGYPVLRVCHKRDQYSSFGSKTEQVGRFVPETGEVAIFNDTGGAVAGKNAIRQIMIAAAWQQYAAAYWPGVQFQRWWLYGTSDYYAQFEPKGKKLRFKSISNPYVYFETDTRSFRLENPMTLAKGDLRGSDHPALSDFFQWDDSKFDGARPANNRALAYTLVDYLARGPEKLGDKFDAKAAKSWREYPAVMAKTKSLTKTYSKVFEGADFEALQDGWKSWVKKQM